MSISAEDVRLKDFLPRSELVVPERPVERARFPVIDAHCHLWEVVRDGVERAARLVELMDSCGIRAIMNLDGGRGPGASMEECVRVLREPFPDRFILFTTLNWQRLEEGEGFGEKMARDLRDAVARGAQGVKIHKTLGLRLRDPQGRLLMPGDPRLDPVFQTAGELGAPVLFHIADPVAFFRPLDNTNERLEELSQHPSWHFYGPEYPSFEELMETQVRFVQRYPDANFISAHVCSYSENLGAVSEMLDACPNLYADTSARFAELGRQPFTARRWFIRYADRILFGSDFTPDVAGYRLFFRLLETEDEYFPYSTGERPGQGRWRIYGLSLPDDVLAKVYGGNAARIIPGVSG